MEDCLKLNYKDSRKILEGIILKVAVVVEKDKVEIQEVDIPDIRDNEVLIKVKTVGVCGSDLHLFKDSHAFRKLPAILGHEVAGKITSIGKSVTKFKVGDRVTVEPHLGCGKCEYCESASVNLCVNKKVPGTPEWGGTFGEYFNAPESMVYKIGDNIPYEIGTLIEPLAVGIHTVARITVPEKDTIAILGSGTIGLLTLVAAREAGYKNIICTDTQPFNLEMARKQGAVLALNPLEDDVEAEISNFTNGRGVDVAIVATDAKVIVDQASEIVRKRGEVGIVSMITEQIPIDTYKFVFKELTLFGAMTYETKDFEKAAKLVNNGLDLMDFITQRLPLSESQAAMDVLSEKLKNVVKVIVEVENEEEF